MVEGISFVLKGIILTWVLTSAATSWGIFDPLRDIIKKVNFCRRLLDCFECSSVWAGPMVVVYLAFFEWWPVTYMLIFSKIATVLNLGYETLDTYRAVKRNQL